MLSIEEKPLVRAAFLLCKKVQVFVSFDGVHYTSKLLAFSQIAQNGREWVHLHTPLQKPVLLRLRLAASEKPVLNAPASACVAELKKGARHGTDNAAPRAAARGL